MQEDAERTIREWESNLREEELAEKRRVAPGWLDREEKILQPAKPALPPDDPNSTGGQSQAANIMDQKAPAHSDTAMQQPVASQEGDELDRAFGSMAMR